MVGHLVKVHRDDPSLHIVCDVSGCQSTFSRVFSYKSHLRRTHKDIDTNIRQPMRAIDIVEPEVPERGGDNNEIAQNGDEIKRLNALYLMKLKEVHYLTQTSLDSVVEGTTAIVQNTVQTIRNEVEKKLRESGQELMDVDGLADVFDQTQPLSNPFAHVKTKSRQTAYQKTNFSLVVSTMKQ
ncbi:hypothetical protein AC249_AIPGENE17010 [Paramuricea clavata]|uniref:Uncharacterized protein n=1 Tax=Paramuricea clavata TaxID=317549 RepID=A0A7D9I1Z1_PARCT|nr:hypothetical protein AC249_AIPGENE17010 [Paramuricea clavata]